ncbi:MAG TPA: NAD(P)-binding domain-containing protein [Tepidisphaeraceae bacterium]|jgi:thioredoxin reductase (NADPH)
MSEHVHEVAVVGAGPIGLELAVALKRAGIDYVQFDAKQIGHTMTWWAPQTRFFSSNERIAISGVPLLTPDQSKATREQYLTYLRTVVETFDLQVRTFEPVVGLNKVGDGFELTTRPRGGERVTRARKIILATGGTDRPRYLSVPGEDLPHVSHYFQDPHTYFHQRVFVVGGKNSAVEAALRCHHAGAHVSLSYRRPGLPEGEIKYWLVPEARGLIKSGRMPAYFNSTVTHITPTHVHLNVNGDAVSVEADFVLLMTGYVQDNTLLKLAGVATEGACQLPLFDPKTMETTIPGLYLAGTAVGGTQDKYKVFIENCHDHVEKILAHAFGRSAEVNRVRVDLPES